MKDILKTTFLGLFFGTFGTTIGGIIGVLLKKNSNRFLSFILSLASGLMLSIVCFDLIPEAFNITGIASIVFGMVFGIFVMFICDIVVQNKFGNKKEYLDKKNSLLKTGIIVSIGLALHNFPEGLAIGAGFNASLVLGYSLAIAICFHDIPEGISMALPMKNGGLNRIKVLFYVFLSGITTGIGAFIGTFIGEISKIMIGISLSFAAGAMLYIVSGELIPEANKLYSGRVNTFGNIIGFLVGVIALKFT